MKIAFVVSFFDFRNDVRKIITTVAASHKVVIMCRQDLRQKIGELLPGQIEFRPIDEKKKSFLNQMWERAYLLFKAIPKTRHNFFLMELFKASNTTDQKQIQKNLQLLTLIRRLPKFISYDFFLSRLRFSGKTKIDDIDQFIFFTAIADDYLLARLLKNRHPHVKVYVYSWDHPCKHTCFSRQLEYAVWNDDMANDIAELQKITSDKITVTGASQFGYIWEYLNSQEALLPRSFSFPYIYFGCAIGIAKLIPDELNVIRMMAGQMKTLRPDLKLVVRPYPVQNDWEVYENLRELDNVILDDGFRTADLSVREIHLMEKFEKTQNAEAFFHLGTTMGLEACFTDTPSFILDIGYRHKSGLSLYNFIHQYQNDKHLINLAPENAIKSTEKLAEVLGDISNRQYRLLNDAVRSKYQVLSFEQVAKNLISKK